MNQKIQSAILIIVLILTLYNTYTIHSQSDKGYYDTYVEQDMSAFAESININASEIQTLKTNIETMVNFMNTKFESLKDSE